VATPSAVMANCENCGEVLHRVIKGKLSGRRDIVFQGVVRCQTCGRISDITIRESKPVKIPVIISWMEDSERIETELGPDILLRVGDLLELSSGNAEVTAIESGGRRVPECTARRVDTVWAKRADMVRVKVTLVKAGRGSPKEIFVAPDKEFCVGDIIEVGRNRALILQIRVEQKTLHRGCAPASAIKRIYAKSGRPVRPSESSA
jgi:uncharacterized Zn finger protein